MRISYLVSDILSTKELTIAKSSVQVKPAGLSPQDLIRRYRVPARS